MLSLTTNLETVFLHCATRGEKRKGAELKVIASVDAKAERNLPWETK